MGGVKTLRTGFLVFGPGFKWFTLLAANVLGVRFLCQLSGALPGKPGLSLLHRPPPPPFALKLHREAEPLAHTELLPAGEGLPLLCTPPKAWRSEASGKCGMKEAEQTAPMHSLNRESRRGPRKGNPQGDARNASAETAGAARAGKRPLSVSSRRTLGLPRPCAELRIGLTNELSATQ